MRDSAWAELPNDVASFLKNVFLVHSITHFVMILGCLSAPCDKSSWSKYLLHRGRRQEEDRIPPSTFLSFFFRGILRILKGTAECFHPFSRFLLEFIFPFSGAFKLYCSQCIYL